MKVSSQLQALAELDESVELVAFIDADSIPAPDWLAAMAAPLADPHLALWVFLLGRLLVPVQCLLNVLRHAATVAIQVAQHHLPQRVILVG